MNCYFILFFQYRGRKCLFSKNNDLTFPFFSSSLPLYKGMGVILSFFSFFYLSVSLLKDNSFIHTTTHAHKKISIKSIENEICITKGEHPFIHRVPSLF